ncbi:MAG TPA: GntR family transcriptional regulator [Ruminococcaceae bacterium]|jgi:DNA-binding transcriptional regulator YhcF (GntR family)|nr:GntR family transcriptional regulator [Oscillospiraceae bacterium]HBQ46159.1 GntR family transcriptional regulator [Oscillospiraceae bacterium]
MLLKIDMTSEVPIYRQIRDGVVLGVAGGRLSAGESLPTVRQLAGDIGVNPMTVNKAYALLKKEGLIVVDRRRGARIAVPPGTNERFGPGFDRRAALLISEARIRGASKREISEHVSELIDGIYG